MLMIHNIKYGHKRVNENRLDEIKLKFSSSKDYPNSKIEKRNLI